MSGVLLKAVPHSNSLANLLREAGDTPMMAKNPWCSTGIGRMMGWPRLLSSVGSLITYIYDLVFFASEPYPSPSPTRHRLTAKIAMQTAQGLAYLHSHSLYHGSLWPHNVMLCGESGTEVQLSDYGRSRRLISHQCEQDATLSASRTQSAKPDFDALFPAYVAIEQVRPHGEGA